MRLAAPFRRQHLITTALELFAAQGYEGTTTREIAKRSGVTEAIIFRHFPTKEDLYWEVIEEQCNIRSAIPRLREMLDSDLDDLSKFTLIAEDILSRNTSDPKLFRLLLFCALENHELRDRFFQTRISERYEILAQHIRGCIRKGTFRKVDPLVAARGFFGMVVYHFLIQEIFGGKKFDRFNPREVSRTLAEIWVAGMLPGSENSPPPQLPEGFAYARSKNGTNGRAATSGKKRGAAANSNVSASSKLKAKKQKKEEVKVL